jgi:hypothetical protein
VEPRFVAQGDGVRRPVVAHRRRTVRQYRHEVHLPVVDVEALEDAATNLQRPGVLGFDRVERDGGEDLTVPEATRAVGAGECPRREDVRGTASETRRRGEAREALQRRAWETPLASVPSLSSVPSVPSGPSVLTVRPFGSVVGVVLAFAFVFVFVFVFVWSVISVVLRTGVHPRQGIFDRFALEVEQFAPEDQRRDDEDEAERRRGDDVEVVQE